MGGALLGILRALVVQREKFTFFIREIFCRSSTTRQSTTEIDFLLALMRIYVEEILQHPTANFKTDTYF